MQIPLYKPYISKNEVEAISRVLKQGKLSRGSEVESFEKEFAQYIGKKFAIATNSGTSALHILVRAFGWKEGDEIITTPFSYIASSNAILFENAKPVFVDIDPKTLNIDPRKIEEKITPKTKGILLVHILGLPAIQDEIRRLSDKYNLRIIEDACEVLGRPSKDFVVGKLGDAIAYGFHENKQLTTAGEGGMIVTDDPIIAQACWSMRDQGRALGADWIQHVTLGFNFRMTEIQAAFGRSQLQMVDTMLARREEIAMLYGELLKGVEGVTTPQQMVNGKRSWFVYFVLLRDSATRDNLHNALSKKGINSSTNYFPPIYNFPMYKGYGKGFPVTDDVSERTLVLPMYYEMTNSEVEFVAQSVIDAMQD